MTKTENTVLKNIKNDVENILRFQSYCSVKGVLDSIRFLETIECRNTDKYRFIIEIYDSEDKRLLDEAFNGSPRKLIAIEDEPVKYILQVICQK